MSPRLRFVIRRTAVMIPVLIAMSVFVFLIIRLIPGDPVRTMLGFRANEENVATIRAQLGLDQPLLDQYLAWAGGLLRLDLGQDFISNVPISQLLAERLPVTLQLTFMAMGLAVIVGIPLGVLAATRRKGVGRVTTGFAVAGISIPDFWLGIMLVLVFAGTFRLLPPSGYVPFLGGPGRQPALHDPAGRHAGGG